MSQTFTITEAMGLLGIKSRQTMYNPQIRGLARKGGGPTDQLTWTEGALRKIAKARGVDIDLAPF